MSRERLSLLLHAPDYTRFSSVRMLLWSTICVIGWSVVYLLKIWHGFGSLRKQRRKLGAAIYAVGGMPRDLILGLSPRDLDLVVEGDAVALANALAQAHGGVVIPHRQFGTATWSRGQAAVSTRSSDAVPSTGSLDLISARTEIYPHPGKLPQVRAATIADDLGRRDFTINAIAIRLDGQHYGQVLDPVGGIDDLRAKRIRALHKRSFVDDPTRMYRAVRYEQRLGFRISGETSALMREGGRWLGAVSGQRLRHELDLILEETRSATMVKRLSGLGLLHETHPSLPADSRSLRRLSSVVPSDRIEHSRETDAGAKFGAVDDLAHGPAARGNSLGGSPADVYPQGNRVDPGCRHSLSGC